MRTSFLAIAAAMTATAAVAAEPPKPASPHALQRQHQPAAIILASADSASAGIPSPDQPTTTPVKRPRVARVTSCRCGDPEAAPAEE